jgi:hypothetical protein
MSKKPQQNEEKNFFIIEEINLDKNGNEEEDDDNNLNEDKDIIEISIGNSREETITKTRIVDPNSPSKSSLAGGRGIFYISTIMLSIYLSCYLSTNLCHVLYQILL